ncbi:MAG: PP2C family protein-serine/threonine phosphatase [Phycisphaerales bacterium]
MLQASITSSALFRERLLRSELPRCAILALLWGFALIGALIRRALGGVVMSADAVFYPAVIVLIVAILLQALSAWLATRSLRTGKPVPVWWWHLTPALDLAVAIASLTIVHFYSPRGAYAALSAPALLGIPVVVMLSILRLRPALCVALGLAGALSHWALVLHTIAPGTIERNLWPLLFTYGLALALTGVAAALVASQMRGNVQEAVAESISAQQSELAVKEMAHDLGVARDIQQGLMPTDVPVIAGYDIAGMARPAQQTGGDYYDWQPLADGRLVVVLADVTGHGIGPALVMAICRAYARASAPAAVDSAALLRQVNALICEDLAKTGRFITMVIAILSPDGTVELVSAGHGPTLLYRRQAGSVESFIADGVPLGVDASDAYSPHRILRLEPGDALLLSTDGFMEWQRAGDGQQFGTDRLEQTFQRAAGGSARAIVEQLDADVQAFAQGALQLDDTSAVAIKRT